MNLFDSLDEIGLRLEPLAAGDTILRRFALSDDRALLSELDDVVALAPFSHMVTPGGFRMSLSMTNCGALG